MQSSTYETLPGLCAVDLPRPSLGDLIAGALFSISVLRQRLGFVVDHLQTFLFPIEFDF